MNKREFVFVVVVTFIVIMIWIIADIMHTQSSAELDPNLNAVLEPLDPTFDSGAIEKIEKYSPIPKAPQPAAIVPVITPSATPRPSVSPIPSSSTPLILPSQSPLPSPTPDPDDLPPDEE